MSLPYNPRTVIKKTSNALLQQFLSPHQAFSGFNWEKLEEDDPEPIIQRLPALEDAVRREIAIRWRQVHALADSAGTAVLGEAARDAKLPGSGKLNFADTLATLRNGHERAFWCLVNHPSLFDDQRVYAHAYSLPRTSRETRIGFPQGEVAVTHELVDSLKHHIQEVYSDEERAKMCRIDHREHDGVHILHAYPSDYSDEVDSYTAEGILGSVKVTPPFHIIFYVNGPAGSVSLLAKGGSGKHAELFNRFSLATYGVPPPPRTTKKTYDLRVLKNQNHQFHAEPKHHISSVRVVVLRLQFPESYRHIGLFEVDADDPKDSIYKLLQKKLSDGLLELKRTTIKSAVLQVVFHPPGGAERIVQFKVSTPRWCDLDDGPDDRIVAGYLPAWGIEASGKDVDGDSKSAGVGQK